MPDPAWASSLRDLLGAALSEIGPEHIERLVKQQVREVAELDFKGTLYGSSEGDKRELAADIASMRNDRGGVIVLGVKDEDGVAVDAPRVELSEDEELRMRQIVAGLTAPHAAFETIRVEKTSTTGFYLLVAPPSPLRPHAVRVGESLRYPRRDGPQKRWLSEPEVAEMYRDRFRGERLQIDRLAQITGETIDRLDKGESESPNPWLVMSLVANAPGAMTMSFPGVTEMREWAHGEHTSRDLMEGFFQELPPEVGVSVQRYTLTSPADRGKPARYPYASCYVDGAGSAATQLHVEPQRDGQHVLLAPRLVFATAGALRILGRHAVRAGAFGDAVVEARVLTPPALLGYAYSNLVESCRNSLLIREARAQLTLPLQSLTGHAQEVLIATRLTLTEIFNAFGVAELPYIATDGTLRVRYWPAGYDAEAWAERSGVATTQETVPE